MKKLLFIFGLALALSCANFNHHSPLTRGSSFLSTEWVGYEETSGGSEWDASHRRAYELNLSGERAAAIKLEEENLENARRHFGAEHPAVAASLNSLSAFHDLDGNSDLSVQLQLEANEIWLNEFGQDHLDYAIGIHNLGYMYAIQKRFNESEELLLQALAIYVKHRGKQSSDAGLGYNHLGMMYGMKGDWETALSYRKKVVPIAARLKGPRSPGFANCLGDVALAFGNLEKYLEAELVLREVISIWEGIHGLDSAELSPYYYTLARFLWEQGKIPEAEVYNNRGMKLEGRDL